MAEDATCSTCRYFVPTGTEDSGLTLPNSREPWRYVVGVCAGRPDGNSLFEKGAHAAFFHCHYHRPKRRAKGKGVG